MNNNEKTIIIKNEEYTWYEDNCTLLLKKNPQNVMSESKAIELATEKLNNLLKENKKKRNNK